LQQGQRRRQAANAASGNQDFGHFHANDCVGESGSLF
jgi:hypothetical protein